MKLLDFSILNGWPGSASTFKFMQEQMLQLQMLSLLGGTNYILSGCANVGGTVGDGFVVINGEVLPFEGGAVQDNVIVVDTPTDRSFFGGTLNTYYHDRVATFGTGATEYAWSSFEINDPASGLLKRMRLVETLIAGLRSDLNALSTSFNDYVPTWASITGKPSALIVYTASVHLGDIGVAPNAETSSDSLFTITIPDNGSSYMVVGSLVGLQSDPNYDNDVMWIVSAKTNTSFKLAIREVANVVKNLNFDFAIIKL